MVLNVDEAKQLVRIGEQNYSNQAWTDDYAREVKFIQQDDQIWLLDEYLIGWKRVVIN